MSIRQLILFSALACSLPSWAQSAAPATSALTLRQALAVARDNSDVLLARHALSAARADIATADHAPLPVLSAKAASIDLQNGVGAGNAWSRKRVDKAIGLDWTWERGGKRALRTQAAQRAADAALADVEDVQSQQMQAALAAYYDLLAAQERLLEVASMERSAAEMARVAARRVKAGDLSQQDALRTHIEAERARAEMQAASRDKDLAALVLAQIVATGPSVQVADDWPALPASEALPAGGGLGRRSQRARRCARGAGPFAVRAGSAGQRRRAAQVRLDGGRFLRPFPGHLDPAAGIARVRTPAVGLPLRG